MTPACWPAGRQGSRCPSTCGTSTTARSFRRSPSRPRHPPSRRRPTSRWSRRSWPAGRRRTSSTASSPARSAVWRCAASSTIRTPAPCAWRSASAPTIVRRSPSSTETCRPSRRSPASLLRWPNTAGPTRAPHPLNRLAPERLLRWRLEQEQPSLLGLPAVVPIAAAGAATERQGPRAVLGPRAARRRHRPRVRRPRGVHGRRRPRPDPVRDRRPAAPAGRRWRWWSSCADRDLLPITADLAALAVQPSLSLVAVPS